MKGVALALLMAAVAVGPLGAQGRRPDRWRERAAPGVLATLDSLVADATGRGLPTEDLTHKAMEGTAKGVAPERVVAALHALADHLAVAADALQLSGPTAAGAIEAGAFALGVGFSPGELASLARSTRAPYTTDQTVRVAGALAVLGVAPADAVEVLQGLMRAGSPAADIAALPARVQAGMGHGALAADAVRGVAGPRSGAVAPGRPPDRPPPGVPPAKPPHPTGKKPNKAPALPEGGV